MKILLKLSPVMMLGIAAACTPLPETARPGEHGCQAPRLQYLVGQPLSAFEPVRPQGIVRVLGPKSVMTMDHMPTRLNVVYDARNRIKMINCG